MTLFMPLLFVCAVMTTNPHHCEVVRVPKVTASLEACTRIVREEAERLAAADPRPFSHMPGDWVIRGQCAAEVLYETMLAKGE